MSRKLTTKSQARPRPLRLESLESRELLTVNMSLEEQLFIELVNRARADPDAEIERLRAFDMAENPQEPLVEDLNDGVSADQTISSDPKPPLAPNQALTDAMIGHVNDMLRRDYFGHDSPTGGTPSSRAMDAGYPVGAGENIAWAGNTDPIDRVLQVYARHFGLVKSVGHRVNMMRDRWLEVGAGVRYGTFTQGFTNFNAIMVGTLFGSHGSDNFITGVAITDHISANNFYEIGEGIGGITITATREGSDDVYTDITGESGGYGVRVPDGTYTVVATDGRVERTVRGVVVDGKNVKVDFNTRAMPTRYIAGAFFEDPNRNGMRESGEPPIEGRIAYLDLNDNNQHDSNEPSERSGADGSFRFSDLIPGDYTVRQVVPEQWLETAPFGDYIIALEETNIIGVDFGSRTLNAQPSAEPDIATVQSGQTIVINVLQNDVDPEGSLSSSSVRVASQPNNGQVTVTADNRLSYTARSGFSGTDQFSYTVADTAGVRSAEAIVTVEVLPIAPWQNSGDPMDVNDDGAVAARDAIIVIRALNDGGPRQLAAAKSQDSFYLDVSGDDFLSAIDAIRIIRYLNDRVAASGEPPESDPSTSESVSPNSATLDSANVVSETKAQAVELLFATTTAARNDFDRDNEGEGLL